MSEVNRSAPRSRTRDVKGEFVVQITKMYQTKNVCFRRNKKMSPTGIVVHSTGVNNAKICRYVGPGDDVIGRNTMRNHWNQKGVKKCVHAFIGKDKDNLVRCYNTLPWGLKTWGCGKGTKGSYNKSHIQFEICEDDLQSEEYFYSAFEKAVELCAFLCNEYQIPTSNVVSHKEASDLGFASNHGDPHGWLKKYNWTMDMFREKVAEAMKNLSI